MVVTKMKNRKCVNCGRNIKPNKEQITAVKIICMVRDKDRGYTDWCEVRLIEEIVKLIKKQK